MKIKVSEATPLQLDWLVAKCEEPDAICYSRMQTFGRPTMGSCNYPDQDSYWPYNPSESWSQGGPIIEREQLEISPHYWNVEGWHWVSCVLGTNNIDGSFEQRGPTPLIAAMRCYCYSKLGDEVEVPDELTSTP